MWIIFALGASVMWGLSYVINEQVYKRISFISSIAITTTITGLVMLTIAVANGFFSKDINNITSSNRTLFFVIIQTVVFIIAELLIALSISSKNATLSGLIEISYPIFIALFAYILFKQNQLNLSTAFGGALIFIGVFVIYYFNK